MPECPLCQQRAQLPWVIAHQKPYYRCSFCDLVWLKPDCRLGLQDERRHYGLHENDPGDPAYRRFLAPLFDAVESHILPASTGLDFGCGPGSALAAMFREAGHEMLLYDPYFVPAADVLQRSFDFICLSEVAEHLFEPRRVFTQLSSSMAQGAVMGVMTQPVPECPRVFTDWHYPRDPTHVVFFNQTSFSWLARHLGLVLTCPHRAVFLLQHVA
jgi:hypothetical protein